MWTPWDSLRTHLAANEAELLRKDKSIQVSQTDLSLKWGFVLTRHAYIKVKLKKQQLNNLTEIW